MASEFYLFPEFTHLLHPYHFSVTQHRYHHEKFNLEFLMKKMSLVLSVFVLTAVLLSACQYNVRRNGDGTASVETTISQQEVQDAVSAAIADPLVQNVTVSLQSGYVLVTGERQRLNDNSKTDALSFRLDLGVSDGHLTATLSDTLLDGAALDQARVDEWSARISSRLSQVGQRSERASLQAVNISPESVTMTWVVSR